MYPPRCEFGLPYSVHCGAPVGIEAMSGVRSRTRRGNAAIIAVKAIEMGRRIGVFRLLFTWSNRRAPQLWSCQWRAQGGRS